MKEDSAINEFNILLVDDKPDNLFILKEILKKEGRNFIKATSGNEALKKAIENPVDLMLLDIQMPNMDGFTVAKLMGSNPKTNKIPIIFVTAVHKSKESMVRGLETGAVDYLLKPLDIDITRAKVESFLIINRQQKELESSKNALSEFRMFINHSDEMLCLIEESTKQIEGVNKKFEKNTGYKEAELLGKPLTDFMEIKDELISVESKDGENLKWIKFNGNFQCSDHEQINYNWKVIVKDGKWFSFIKPDI